MPHTVHQSFIDSSTKLFQYYKQLGEKTIGQLDDESLFWQFNPESNSIAITVNHLWGNMLSRWTNFLKEDGEKAWRNRDLEFEDVIKTRTALMEKWEAGWACLFEALSTVNENNLDEEIFIRNQGHSIVEAIQRQLGHYAYHIGQIVYTGRMVKGAEWTSLSIPKGGSKSYNEEKFSKEKGSAHFTDEMLDKPQT